MGVCLMDWICVRCGGRLVMREEGLACDSCGQGFPIVGEVPVLVADPDLFLQITKLILSTLVFNWPFYDENLWKEDVFDTIPNAQNAPKSRWMLARKIKFLSVTDALLQ